MNRNRLYLAAAFLAYTALASGVYAENDSATRPVFDESGVVHVPAFELPPSELSSQEARDFMKLRARMPSDLPTKEPDIEKSRKGLAAMLAPQLAGMLEMYPVEVAEQEIGGVPTRVVTPGNYKFDPERILINLHGGAFNTCWESCSVLESAPIAVLGGYRVVSVNYRMAPEAVHPAGVEDVAKVYRELLKSYKAKHIGIYGCSAGGALTAQAAAWLPAHDLPQAGAVGIFGAGGVRINAGDSSYIAGYIDGSFPPPAKQGEAKIDMTRGYFAGSDMSDVFISPALHLDVLKKFPPALIITGTRAMDMSSAIVTNSQLIKAGGRSTLIVGEGMGHCYIYSPQLPEAQDAFAAIVSFFGENLR
ncbi:MAG: monoterpene epsilon-lactone hydrolase [Halieaceae bacterium]|jgi:monoterpene epsilon-lactone hydrolase